MKGPTRQLFFVVVLPNGTVVRPVYFMLAPHTTGGAVTLFIVLVFKFPMIAN